MKKNVLSILSSPRGASSVSNKLSAVILEKIIEKYPESTIVVRDVAKELPPHLNEAYVTSIFTPEANRTDAQKQSLVYSDEAIAEIQNADIIVMNAPVYEFSITAMLKAYLDQITRAGITFKYSEEGYPVGLLTNKKLYIAIASGGIYSEGFMAEYDFVGPYLQKLLGFLGISDITIIRAEGLNKGTDEDKAKAYQKGIDIILID